ncbi:hypothetical protein D3C74_493260 [compost metagenome]
MIQHRFTDAQLFDGQIPDIVTEIRGAFHRFTLTFRFEHQHLLISFIRFSLGDLADISHGIQHDLLPVFGVFHMVIG